jgi:hypothetical protein
MKQLLVLAVALLLGGNAFADIIYLNQTIDLQGTGVGQTDPIVRLQSQGAGDVETGCIAPNGSGGQTNTGCGFTDDAVLQSNLRELDSLNLANASDFRIVFNGIEPEGNDQEGITIDALEIVLYTAAGVAVETFALQAPVTIPDTIQGQGQAGFLFGLDATQAALLQPLLGGGLLIGGGAQFSDAQGGPDSIFLFNAGNRDPGDVVPEPSTWALMAIGVPLVIAARRWKLAAR